MRRFSFSASDARRPNGELLENVTIAPLTESGAQGGLFQAACFRIGPGGRVARHPATVCQLLAVVEGSGWVSGADGELEPVSAGDAIVWEEGEEHETRSDEGLTAIVIESSALRPFAGR